MAEDKLDDLGMRLVDEGARLLARDGPAGLSLRRLATVAGTSTMAVYTRFGDKQRLLAAMHREGFRRLGDRLVAARGDGPIATLTALGHAYRATALADPHLYQLMFGRAAAQFAPDAEGRAASRATYDPLVDAVRAAVHAGMLVGDADAIALHLWAVTHGMVSLELNGQLPEGDPDELYTRALVLAATPFIPAAARGAGDRVR